MQAFTGNELKFPGKVMPLTIPQGQFAHGHAMARANGFQTDIAGKMRLQHRPFHGRAAYWVRPIKHQRQQLVLRGRFQTEEHGADERVIAAADILQVDDQGIQATQPVQDSV